MRQSLASASEKDDMSDTEVNQQILGVNSVITPLHQNAARAAVQRKSNTYALKRDGKQRLMMR